MQDVGLNGMNSENERRFYRQGSNPYLAVIDNLYAQGSLSEAAYQKIIGDPAGDDFRYFRGREQDQQEMSILERYKYFNNPEGNSRPSEDSGESFSTAATNLPDRSEEHTSELQSRPHLVCRLLLEKKNNQFTK